MYCPFRKTPSSLAFVSGRLLFFSPPFLTLFGFNLDTVQDSEPDRRRKSSVEPRKQAELAGRISLFWKISGSSTDTEDSEDDDILGI